MRLGLLGPAYDDLDVLEGAARFLFGDLTVDRVIYLHTDGALDRVVQRWAAALVEGDPGESAIWTRAERCVDAGPTEIDVFIARERQRRALKVFESLPGDGTRVIELLDGKVAVMIHDKESLDEEDMLPAAFLVFGKSAQPVVRQVGSRWFLSPGQLDPCGIMVLEDREDGVHLKLFDRERRELRSERLVTGHVVRVRVDGS